MAVERAFSSIRLLAAAFLAGLAGLAVAGGLAAGPMPGRAGEDWALLWLQGKEPGRVEVDYWPEDEPKQVRRADARLDKAEDYTAHLRLEGLKPAGRYRYRLRLNGEEEDGVYSFRTAGPLPSLTIALGSCAYVDPYDKEPGGYGGGFGIFDRIAELKPDLMLWLGDNLYFRDKDLKSPAAMDERYRLVRADAVFRRLLPATAHLVIWDDHDYGPNDTDAHFIYRDASLRLFKRYWANGEYGTTAAPGIFSRARYGDVELFLLDGRSYRETPGAGASLYGAGQLAWLKEALAASTAPFKLIAGGSQFLSDGNGYESWGDYPEERRLFLDWLAGSGIGGVLLLSGDRHFTSLRRLDRQGLYPLYELTCSPLTSSPERETPAEAGDPSLPAAYIVHQRNFCTLAVDGPANARRLTMRAHAGDGRPLWAKSFEAGDLGRR